MDTRERAPSGCEDCFMLPWFWDLSQRTVLSGFEQRFKTLVNVLYSRLRGIHHGHKINQDGKRRD